MPNAYRILSLVCLAAAGALAALGFPEENGARLAVSGLAIAIGLVLLVKGADDLIHGAVHLARHLGVSPFLIGVTVVAFGTSLPELAAGIGATLRDKGDLAVGNVLGSNIANVGLILGVTALVIRIPVDKSVVRIDAPLVVAITGVVLVLMLDRFTGLREPGEGLVGLIGRPEGVALVVGLAAYVTYNAVAGKLDKGELEEEFEKGQPPATDAPASRTLVDLSLVVLGIASLILGAQAMVDGSVIVAAALNIPDLVIGLTVIAIGTSLPELALSIQAARRGHAEIAVGNVLGSNTFNLLCVLGIASLVNPLPIPESAIRDLAVCAGFTVAMLVMLTTRRGLSRTEGLVLVASYVIYMGVVGLDVVPPQGGG